MTGSPEHRPEAYRAWLVDLDGTLYFKTPVRAAMALELLWSGRDAIGPLREFRREHEQLRAASAALVTEPYQTQLAGAARRTGMETPELEALVREWMIERPGRWLRAFRRRTLLAEIGNFRARGGKSALVSDYPAQTKLRELGATLLFDTVVAVGEVHGPSRLKPDPEGLLLAAERLAVAPEHCLVIGDRPDADGAAARAAGMAFRRV